MSVGDCGSPSKNGLSGLRAPTRNRYFYGKLLDSLHLEMEQSYHNRKRWLMNRLSVGTGALCGLEVVATRDGRGVYVLPGVALDGLGREIIVPAPTRPVDPTVLTDECGQASGRTLLRGGTATLYLCYHECPREPAPVLVDECGPKETCEFGIVEERYRIQVRPGRPEVGPGLLPPEVCKRLFGFSPKESLKKLDATRDALSRGAPTEFLGLVNELRERRGALTITDVEESERQVLYAEERAFWVGTSGRRGLLCHFWGLRCPTPEDPCVPLALIDLGRRGEVLRVENCSVRPVLYSNAELLELILCLAARVDQCCAEPTVNALEKVSGDNQVGVVGRALPEPLVVKVTKGATAVANEDVIFEALGDGRIGADASTLGATYVTKTGADGTAELPLWQMGSAEGTHVTLARIADGMPSQVFFRASAQDKATLPTVRALWPPSAVTLYPGGARRAWWDTFMQDKRIEITFDRRMNEAHLDAPDAWLGVYYLVQEAGGVAASRQRLVRDTTGLTPVPGAAGVTEIYRMSPAPGTSALASERLLRALRVPDTTSSVEATATSGGSADTPTATTPVTSSFRVLVLARARAGNIREAAAPNHLLDGEFAGTALDADTLDELWAVAVGGTTVLDAAAWDALVDTGAMLPESGEGHEGGDFHAWFEVNLG